MSLTMVGCGGSDSGDISTPYDPGSGTVVGGKDGEQTITDTSCGDPYCEAIVDRCGKDGAGDVVLTGTGDVGEVVCYGQDVTVVDVPTAPVPDYTTDGNNAVLVIDGADDGLDVTGDLTISGNNAIVYGAGPDKSVIGGTVLIQKNNAKLRGIRIKGDVTIDKNDTKLVECVIEGDLTITGNNTTVASCDVWGTVTVSGLNTRFASDRFNGVDSIDAKNGDCVENTRFDDENEDGIITDDEVGGPVTCK